MKVFIAALLIIFGVAALSFITPWWVPPFWVVLIASMMKLDIKTSLVIGGACYVLVGCTMAWYMSTQDAADIITKTGTLMGGISNLMMLVVIGIISLVTGSLAGWLGSVMGSYFRMNNRQVKLR